MKFGNWASLVWSAGRSSSSAGVLRQFCGSSAGVLQEFCGISAGVLREFCESSAGGKQVCMQCHCVQVDLFKVERLGVWQGRVRGLRKSTTVSSRCHCLSLRRYGDEDMETKV